MSRRKNVRTAEHVSAALSQGKTLSPGNVLSVHEIISDLNCLRPSTRLSPSPESTSVGCTSSRSSSSNERAFASPALKATTGGRTLGPTCEHASVSQRSSARVLKRNWFEKNSTNGRFSSSPSDASPSGDESAW
eukprot:5313410-Pleurochrysis_carterae.AAC.1